MDNITDYYLNEKSIYYKNDKGIIVCDDAFMFLERIKSNSADIVFLDPPFNLGKKYGNSNKADDLKSDDKYMGFINKIICESVRVLKNGGALYLYHIPKWAFVFADYLSETLNFRHWISISMKNGFVRQDYLYPAHYALLYFTKGEPGNFSRPKIPAPRCRHCGDYIKDYGGYEKYIEQGINLSDVWVDLSPVRHSKYKNRSSNELPVDLLRRIVKISGVVNGLLVDPFVGAGTSVVASIENEMNFIVCDREETSCEVTRDRYLENN